MFRYTDEQRLFILDEYFRTRSFVLVRRLFRDEFPNANVPAKSTIQELVKKWHNTGSVSNSKPAKRRKVRTKKFVAGIADFIKRNPHRSTRSIAKQSGITLTSMQRIMRDIRTKDGDASTNKHQDPQESSHYNQSEEGDEDLRLPDDDDNSEMEKNKSEVLDIEDRQISINESDSSHSNQSEEGDVGLRFHDDDDNSETEETKSEALYIEDTQISINEPVEVTPHYPTPMEFDKFGEYIAKHLQQLPIDAALKLQSDILNLVAQTRLEYIHSEASSIVKQEPPIEDENEDESQVETVAVVETSEPPRAKRFKPERNKPTTTTSHTKHKKPDYAVFAEHIVLQLEQLPEEISLRLQTDIFALLSKAHPKTFDASNTPICVSVEAEPENVRLI